MKFRADLANAGGETFAEEEEGGGDGDDEGVFALGPASALSPPPLMTVSFCLSFIVHVALPVPFCVPADDAGGVWILVGLKRAEVVEVGWVEIVEVVEDGEEGEEEEEEE